VKESIEIVKKKLSKWFLSCLFENKGFEKEKISFNSREICAHVQINSVSHVEHANGVIPTK
jgi:hypothetical protein